MVQNRPSRRKGEDRRQQEMLEAVFNPQVSEIVAKVVTALTDYERRISEILDRRDGQERRKPDGPR